MNWLMTSVLFVCLGNICRSPTAEAVLKASASYAGLDLTIDSASTSGWHTGQPPDARAVEHGKQRGYRFDGQRSSYLEDADFTRFDYIIAMDEANLQAIHERAPDGASCEIALLLDYAPDQDVREVPDPYYSGSHGFERVLDLIELGCTGLLTRIKSKTS